MIIIGYQGIGKSTYCAKSISAIDLESSMFRDFRGNRIEHWEEPYVLTAINLSDQGYDVFISSHAEVRQALVACMHTRYKGVPYCAIVPSLYLKDDWIKRLEDRYNKYPSQKNYAALMNAKENFEDNIKLISDDIDNTFYILDHPDQYDIFKLMDKIKKEMQ